MCWQFVCILLLISCQLILFVGRRFVSISIQLGSVSHIQFIPLFEFQPLSIHMVYRHTYLFVGLYSTLVYLNHWSESHARLSIPNVLDCTLFNSDLIAVFAVFDVQFYFCRCCQATLNEVMSRK